MKKTISITLSTVALFLFFLNLTKIADELPPDPSAGMAFSLKSQRVIECTPSEITLVNRHNKLTHLEKDGDGLTPASWPDCSTFHAGEVLDFYLSRGAKTKFLSQEKTVWWRKSM